MSETTEPGTALAILPRAALPTILAADDKDIFGKLFEELKDFAGDVSTAKGRAEIASKARKVAVAKMDLIRLADGLKEDAIKTQRAINDEVKIVKDKMDTLRDHVRAPLDEYEAVEAARIKANEDAIKSLELLADDLDGLTPADIEARQSQIVDFEWSVEFRQRGERVRSGVIAQLRLAHQAAVKREAAAVEAAQLAAEEAERQRLAAIEAQRVREEQIATEAAERARIAAEEKAAREAGEAEERAQAALREAEARAQAERDAAARREREAAQALADAAERERRAEAERAERERVIAERERLSAEQAEAARIEVARRAEAEKAAAVEAERQRVAREAEAERVETERKARNRAHSAAINNDVLADLIAHVAWPGGLPEALARDIVTAIAKGEVAHTKINYADAPIGRVGALL